MSVTDVQNAHWSWHTSHFETFTHHGAICRGLILCQGQSQQRRAQEQSIHWDAGFFSGRVDRGVQVAGTETERSCKKLWHLSPKKTSNNGAMLHACLDVDVRISIQWWRAHQKMDHFTDWMQGKQSVITWSFTHLLTHTRMRYTQMLSIPVFGNCFLLQKKRHFAGAFFAAQFKDTWAGMKIWCAVDIPCSYRGRYTVIPPREPSHIPPKGTLVKPENHRLGWDTWSVILPRRVKIFPGPVFRIEHAVCCVLDMSALPQTTDSAFMTLPSAPPLSFFGKPRFPAWETPTAIKPWR